MQEFLPSCETCKLQIVLALVRLVHWWHQHHRIKHFLIGFKTHSIS